MDGSKSPEDYSSQQFTAPVKTPDKRKLLTGRVILGGLSIEKIVNIVFFDEYLFVLPNPLSSTPSSHKT